MATLLVGGRDVERLARGVLAVGARAVGDGGEVPLRRRHEIRDVERQRIALDLPRPLGRLHDLLERTLGRLVAAREPLVVRLARAHGILQREVPIDHRLVRALERGPLRHRPVVQLQDRRHARIVLGRRDDGDADLVRVFQLGRREHHHIGARVLADLRRDELGLQLLQIDLRDITSADRPQERCLGARVPLAKALGDEAHAAELTELGSQLVGEGDRARERAVAVLRAVVPAVRVRPDPLLRGRPRCEWRRRLGLDAVDISIFRASRRDSRCRDRRDHRKYVACPHESPGRNITPFPRRSGLRRR